MPPRYDAIIVLGAGVWKHGHPSPALQRRIVRGVEAFREGAAPTLVMSGGLGRNPPIEADVMSRVAREMGVPDEAIVAERSARSTDENARYCAILMRERGWNRALIITDGWHLPRALMTFRAYGATVDGDSAGGGRAALGWDRWLRHVVREGFAYVLYACRLRLIGSSRLRRRVR